MVYSCAHFDAGHIIFTYVRPSSVYPSTSFLRLVWVASFLIAIAMDENSNKGWARTQNARAHILIACWNDGHADFTSWSRVLVGCSERSRGFWDAGSAIAGRVMEFQRDLGRSKLLKTRQMRLSSSVPVGYRSRAFEQIIMRVENVR